jgi:hypothetical protein
MLKEFLFYLFKPSKRTAVRQKKYVCRDDNNQQTAAVLVIYGLYSLDAAKFYGIKSALKKPQKKDTKCKNLI